MAKVFVTGSAGFIGRHLIDALLREGHNVYALVRNKNSDGLREPHENLIYLLADFHYTDTIKDLPEDIEVAYYLMHSMSDKAHGLVQTEKQVATNFISALKKTKVRQLIYLGAMINDEALSLHLKSRKVVEKVLKESGFHTTILRSSIIIGSGSASFEIIRDLVEKLPIMVAPRWVNSLCQPIGVSDVIFYLLKVMLNPRCDDRTFDIGGPDVLTFKQVLQEYAKFRHLKRYIITVPVLTPRLSSYWLVFLTKVPFSLASFLVESMRTSTQCRDKSIDAIIPHKCLNYKEALENDSLDIAQTF